MGLRLLQHGRIMKGENRFYARTDMNCKCTVDYQLDEQHRRKESTCTNISATGALIVSEETIPIGNAVTLKIDNVPPLLERASVTGTVVRVKPCDRGYEIGIEKT